MVESSSLAHASTTLSHSSMILLALLFCYKINVKALGVTLDSNLTFRPKQQTFGNHVPNKSSYKRHVTGYTMLSYQLASIISTVYLQVSQILKSSGSNASIIVWLALVLRKSQTYYLCSLSCIGFLWNSERDLN